MKGRGWNAMSDPVVVVEVMGQKQSTEIKKNTVNAVWDQVLFFEFKDLDAAAINEGKCTLSVFDANTISRNVLIGAYELDLATVYFHDEYHEIYKQWLGLFDTTDEYEGIQGYLRVSVVVLGPNDEQKTHKLVDDDESESQLVSVLMPPSIEQSPYLLSVSIYEARDLSSDDVGLFTEQCDPFAICEFGGIRMKSKVKKGTTVDMMCELHLPVMEPVMASTIKLSFYDWNIAKRNDRIGCLLFDYHQIKADNARNMEPHDSSLSPLSATKTKMSKNNKNKSTFNESSNCLRFGTPKWYNLYGAPPGYQRGIARKMNQGFVEGTAFRGQVLLSLKVQREEKRPKKGVVDIGLAHSLKPKQRAYVLKCDLYEGSEIHKVGKQMMVEISIGKYRCTSKPAAVKDGRCEWFQVIASNDKHSNSENDARSSSLGMGSNEERASLVPKASDNIGPLTLPVDVEQCPDVFLYLCSASGRKVSYLRMSFKEIVDAKWNNGPSWFNLKEDKAIDALNEHVCCWKLSK